MGTMVPEASRHPRIQNVTTAGTTLAVALLPLVLGVLLARSMAADPLTPVNALMTSGQRPRIAPSQWREYGRKAMPGRGRRSVLRAEVRRVPHLRRIGRAG